MADPAPIGEPSTSRTLLLNSTYEPMQVISWQRAITMVWLDKVEVIRNYERPIRTVSRSFPMPAVVRLRAFVRRRRVRLGFSRRSVFTRDGFRCQYCGRSCLLSELTCDHVIPRSQGGVTDWENVVTSCAPCNRKKGGLTPEQANMRLLRPPHRPRELPLVCRIKLGQHNTPDAWRDFLAWGDALGDRRATG